MSTLFLSHRIPYPPDKGDKIRSYHFLKHLCAHGEVHLCCLMDDPADARHIPRLEAMCASVTAVPLNRRLKRLASLANLATGEAMSLAYFGSRRLRTQVDALLAGGGIDLVFGYSSVMAGYVGERRPGARPPLVVDFVDVDSEKWRQYGERFTGPLGWLYRREARTLAAFERRAAGWCDRVLLVSEGEAALLREWAPGARIDAVPNGVDLDYFRPGDTPAAPLGGGPALVFTGAMDYWPNVDAVCWFADEVFPKIRAAVPGAEFHIVGSSPVPAVRRLADPGRGIRVTGRVPDVRPYLEAADLVVTPMRFGRGVQNKVVEAMAMAKAVVTTPLGLEGIAAAPGDEVVVAEGVEDFARACADLLGERGGDRRRAVGKAARAWVERAYTWERSLMRLDGLLAEVRAQAGGRVSGGCAPNGHA